MTDLYADILDDVLAECYRSDQKHGDQMHLPLGTDSQQYGYLAESAKNATDVLSKAGLVTWVDIAQEEVLECFAEDEPAKARAEAVQAAAMFVKIIRRCDLELEKTDV